MVQCIAVCCSVLQCVAVCCSAWQCYVGMHFFARGFCCVAVRCNVMQCVAVLCCSAVLQHNFLFESFHGSRQMQIHNKVCTRKCRQWRLKSAYFLAVRYYTRTHTHTHTHTHTRTHTRTHIYTYTHTHTHRYIYVRRQWRSKIPSTQFVRTA